MIDITSHRRIARRPVSVRRRKVAKRVCEKVCTEWRVLESGVLAIKTGVEIVTERSGCIMCGTTRSMGVDSCAHMAGVNGT